MKAFLILEDGTVLTGESFGAAREVISEVVFNTSMTGYLEILTDPSYAGQSVVMTYPLIGNYGICMEDMESIHPWPKALIVRECAKLASNFRNEMTLDEFLKKYDVPGISGIDTRHLTRILREYGVMNGMITTREDFDLDEVVKQLKEYKVQGVVREVSCKEKRVLPGDGFKVALMDFGAKKNIEKSLNKRGCEVTVYPLTQRQKRLSQQIQMESCFRTVLEIQRNVWRLSRSLRSYLLRIFQFLVFVLDISSWHLPTAQIQRR